MKGPLSMMESVLVLFLVILFLSACYFGAAILAVKVAADQHRQIISAMNSQ